MFRLKLIPSGTSINFIKYSKIFITFSVALIIICVSSLSFKGLNYGIDFKGGYIFEVQMPKEPDIAQMRSDLGNLGLGSVSIQQFGGEKDLLIKLEKSENGATQSVAIQKVKESLGKNVIYKRVETVGAKVGSELINNAIKAVVFALLAMLGYIIIRFEWQFGLCAVTALFHDCIVIFGMFSIFPWEFSETSITAVLLTASYSINDIVVIFDRIRENLKRYETLSRTVLTATTTLLAMVALYLFGGKVIASLALPMMVGIIVGTITSTCIAAPLLTYLNLKTKETSKTNSDVPQL